MGREKSRSACILSAQKASAQYPAAQGRSIGTAAEWMIIDLRRGVRHQVATVEEATGKLRLPRAP